MIPSLIEQQVLAYPYLLREGVERRYTDEQLRVMLSEVCEHGNPVLEVCQCGSGDMDADMSCEECM